MKFRFPKLIFPFLFATSLLLTFFASIAETIHAEENAQNPSHLHPLLAKALLTANPDEYLPIIIEWARDPDLTNEAAMGPDRLSMRIQVIAALQEETRNKTEAILSRLETAENNHQAKSIRTFWISPVIALQAQPVLIEELNSRDDIVQIRIDEPLQLDPLRKTETYISDFENPEELLWNLSAINIELAEQVLGLDGTGVVVANIDSGVDWLHPALMNHYRGYRPGGLSIHYGNWHVSTNETYTYPGDGFGHGTHTMGTMVGDDGQGTRVGVAPGAQWIAVKVFTNGGITYESWVHDAYEWIIAPEGNPAFAPDVVSNSWGSTNTTDERYRPDMQALRSAGILPIFSAGNNGPSPETVGIPAAYPESLAVGALDDQLNPASFSSRGPTDWGEIKPEIAAPGVDVLSTFPGGGYILGDGTSMAAPHVAGVAALLLQADPTLTPVELESILKFNATPLGSPIPNNETGRGIVNAYLAALQVINHGELTGNVYRSDGVGIVNPIITTTPSTGGSPAMITGDETGAFSLFLAPGLYNVTASAFGFVPDTLVAVQIVTDTETHVSFSLTQLPHGAIFGQVLDAETSVPLSATLIVENTPVSVQTNPNTGAYSLSLPVGNWEISVHSDAHRIAHLTLEVQEGQGTQVNISLTPSPRILLIDSGRWYYNSKVSYFEDALNSLDYFYHLREVRNPFGSFGPSDAPTLSELELFDLVIWSAPLDSPGFIQISDVITGYLSTGGSLLLSGQDVAFWDGGGNLLVPPVYFPQYFGAKFEAEGLLDNLTGILNSPLEGLTITLNTSDSDNAQYHPDNIEINNPLVAEPTLQWPDGQTGGLIGGGCYPYRAAWLGFGLEGAGPRDVRIQTLDLLLEWFVEEPPVLGIQAIGPVESLIAASGETISDVIQIANTGTNTDTYSLDINGDSWPVTLQVPDGSFMADGSDLTIPGCTNLTLTATITIPAGLPRDTSAEISIDLTSQTDPSFSASALLNAKTPAPILLLDDSLWQYFGDDYAATMNQLDLSYDLVTLKGKKVISPRMINYYPLVLWTTGLDWADPVTAKEEKIIKDYLHQGGRLLITSQDLLEERGLGPFVTKELGVLAFTFHTSPTQVIAAPDSPLGDIGLHKLDYPYQNWSDHIVPVPGALPILMDQNLGFVGIAYHIGDQRTAFFSFPLETLDEQGRQSLIGKTLLWISPVGESQMAAPPVAAEGSTIPITLTIGSATTQTLSNVQANLPLPNDFTPVSGSLQGGWTYNSVEHTLNWTGDLEEMEVVVLRAQMNLTPDIQDGKKLLLRAFIDAGDQLVLTTDAEIVVNVPWIIARMQVTPETLWPGQQANYQLILENTGFATAMVQFTNTLPVGLSLITNTVQASSGDILPQWGRIEWNGSIPPGDSVVVTYSETAHFGSVFDPFVTWVEIVAPYQRVAAWESLYLAGQAYFPIIWRP